MAVISRQYGLLFLLNPRTAGSAVARYMIDELGGEWLPGEDEFDNDGRMVFQRKHNTLRQLLDRGHLEPGDARRLFKFTTVRNPFDSLVSLYTKRKYRYREWMEQGEPWVFMNPGLTEDIAYCQQHGFNAWVRRHYWKPALGSLLGKSYTVNEDYPEGMDFVMRFEFLQEDFAGVMRRNGVPGDRRIPLDNPTNERRMHYREAYDGVTRRMVARAFQTDLATYGYSY